MLSTKFYTLENVDRVKYAQMAVIALSVIVCGYLAFSSLTSVREIWTANQSLHREQLEWSRISREMKSLKRVETKMQSLNCGGIELFAVEFSRWASSRGLKVESLVPEGTPAASEITVDNANIGMWNSNKVRVQGYGNFENLMDLLKEFSKPVRPVKLESFSLQSSESSVGVVRFDLLLTVYEKKSEAS